MKLFIHIFFIALLAGAFASCTSARWTIKDKTAVDKSDYEVLEKDQFLVKKGEVNQTNPVLNLDLMSRTKYRYPQRILAERQIQDYRLRPGFVAMGLSGAALAFVAANSSLITKNRSKTHVWTLNTVGTLLAASGFLNMKAVGEARPTGEERYLRKSGSVIQVDTTKVEKEIKEDVSLSLQFGDITIYEDSSRTFSNDQLKIPLAEHLDDLKLSGVNPGSISVSLRFRDSLYSYQFPISQILQPYARVTTQITPLRNSPEVSGDNIVADLARGSQVQIKSTDNENWYQVLYGISEHYIRKENAEIVWRPSDFSQQNQVVTLPRKPFGEIDVESNIPILRGTKENTLALIITNQNYSGRYEERNYAHRDGRLIKTYLRDALGYPRDNIYELKDIANSGSLDRVLSEMRFAANDSTELTVFISGYGNVQKPDIYELNLVGVADGEGDNQMISLRKLYEQFSTITSGQTLILNDVDFSGSSSSDYSANQAQIIIEQNADELIRENEKASILFSTHLNQPTSLYTSSEGEDKKHYIFPYFFAKALQQRRTKLAAIYQYLERNVSYTARKLHDRPQDPLLLGNTLMDLRDE